MKQLSVHSLVNWACVFALIALALMGWSFVDPRPVSIMVAMSIGQVIGTLSFGAFLLAITIDLRRARVLQIGKSTPPPSRPGGGIVPESVRKAQKAQDDK